MILYHQNFTTDQVSNTLYDTISSKFHYWPSSVEIPVSWAESWSREDDSVFSDSRFSANRSWTRSEYQHYQQITLMKDMYVSYVMKWLGFLSFTLLCQSILNAKWILTLSTHHIYENHAFVLCNKLTRISQLHASLPIDPEREVNITIINILH